RDRGRRRAERGAVTPPDRDDAGRGRSADPVREIGVGPHPEPWPDDPRLDPELLAGGDRRNVEDRFRYWRREAIIAELDLHRHSLHVAIENLEHDANIGSVVRTANAFAVGAFHIVGRRRWNRRGAMVTEIGTLSCSPVGTAATSRTGSGTGGARRSSPSSTCTATACTSRSRTSSTTRTSARWCAPPTPSPSAPSTSWAAGAGTGVARWSPTATSTRSTTPTPRT